MHSSSIIFHHPGPVAPNGRSGSQIRPWRLLEAFHESGYEVEAVTGYGAERLRQIRRLKSDIRRGRRFDFVYSESRSIPTLLTEKHRFPRYPLLDFRFIHDLRKNRIPIGLYYRDIFWRFDMYRDKLPWPARAITVPLYHYDWWWYKRTIDHLFLPSLQMAKHLPDTWPLDRLSTLPPGTRITNTIPVRRSTDGLLRLLYVGGVRPPTYDITPLLDSIKLTPSLRLTLCCRREEWEKHRRHYSSHLSEKVKVVHLSGGKLLDLYADADILALVLKSSSYLDIAVPVKVFESIGYGVPVMTIGNNAAATLIEQDNLGWVASDVAEAQSMLKRLAEHPALALQKRQRVSSARRKHTWMARVNEIQQRLNVYRN